MCKNAVITIIAAILMLALAVQSGCASAERRPEPAPEPAAAPSEPQPAEAAPAKPAAEEQIAEEVEEPQPEDKLAEKEKDLKNKRKELEKKERQLAKLERDLRVARLKLGKAELSMAHTEHRNEVAIAKAEAEFELAVRRLETYNERNVPSRLEWTKLHLQGAEDRVQEAREEIEQLEKMYGEEEFADQTKEIVLERGRRRLERSLRDLGLRHMDAETLKEATIPVERREHELRVENAEQTLKRAHENVEPSMIDQQIGLISAEGEIIRLEHEMDDLRDEIEEAGEELEKAEKELQELKAAEAEEIEE